ncbi:8-amino-7-oxononanoate synthase [Novispirillum sp. DQ9]|uniref:8-amino-7-oxononanoate synthase n=1 Tax=Novispirillum sp. DQ9 TaxID=3398612 RepID=UPI003C7CB9A7
MDRAFLDRLDARLADLDAAGRRRVLRPVAPRGAHAGMVERDGRPLINLAANDSLGLSRHPALIARAREWAERFGVGATASRLVCGTFPVHTALEERLAALKGTEAALIFNSGFQANAGVLAALCGAEATGGTPLVYTDRLNHASMHEGLQTAGVRQIRFRHNDMGHLADLLRRDAATHGPRFIVTESVFSMDGDRADLLTLADLAEQHGAFLYVDEAHATGVLGPRGAGLTAQPGVRGRVDLIMGTFGKALGGFGAYVACSRTVRDWLVSRCAAFIYSTALPPPVLGAIDAALDLLPDLEAERARVLRHAARVRAALNGQGIDTLDSSTHIVPAILGEERAALAAQARLEDAGVLGIAIRPPTVPAGTSRLRLSLSAAHTDADIDTVVAALAEIGR